VRQRHDTVPDQLGESLDQRHSPKAGGRDLAVLKVGKSDHRALENSLRGGGFDRGVR
jgi:hypothetical protein